MKRLLLPAAILCFISAIFLSLALAFGKSQPAVLDVFDAVQMYMPGEPAWKIEAQEGCYRYSDRYSTYETSDYLTCRLANNVFSFAFINLHEDRTTVQSAHFVVRRGTLRAGDLIRWFDELEIRRSYGMRMIRWTGGKAWLWVNRRTLFTPYRFVTSIQFLDTGENQ